jgi:3',5'-cyclic AMP phosphodiesterase CpdA
VTAAATSAGIIQLTLTQGSSMQERFGLDVAPHERKPTAWYALGGLWRVAREQLWSLNLLRNLDRRETFTGPFELIRLPIAAAAPGADDAGLWIDFIADTGDGGNATTAVAQAMLAPRLQADGLPEEHAQGLPAARLLVLGGDLAYPGASPAHFQARLVEPFELARPLPAFDEDKVVVAIPQNHDWLDSLSTFCRYFVNDRKAGLLGAQSPQKRSYFALALPHGWHLLGFDFALSGDLDRVQFDAFRQLLQTGAIPAGSPVLLLYPEPYWTREIGDRSPRGYPKRYQRLEALLQKHGCQIRLRLAGDLHHYVRESLPEAALGYTSELVTCGSGGAFGHPTHSREVTSPKFMQMGIDASAAQADLRDRVFIGRSPGGKTEPEHDATLEQVHRFARAEHCYPEPHVTRRRAWINVVALLWGRNLAFAASLGGLMALAKALPGVSAWAGLLPAAVAAATVATENDPAHARLGDWLMALPLLAGMVALMAGLIELQPAWARAPAAVLGVGLLVGSYLAVASALFGRLPNNAASALPGEHDKGFLRLRVHAGGIEAFMLGLDDVPQRWHRNPEGWPRWRPLGKAPRWRLVDRFNLRR